MNLKKAIRNSFVTCFLMLVGITGIAKAANPTSQPGPIPGSSVFNFLITDPDDKPVPGAAINLYIDGKSSKSVSTADGHVLVPVARPPTSHFSMQVRSNGFIDEFLQWQSPRNDPVPSTYTAKLQRGVKIGGKVVDDAGAPVAGAHVEVWVSKRLDDRHMQLSANATIRTGKDGTWTYPSAPENGRINVGAWDYRFANGDFYNMTEVPFAQAKEGAFTITLTRGLPIEGVVLTPEGTPLVGARVATGGQMASNRIPAQKTDKNGKFTYAAKPGEEVVLTTTAKGYATELTQVVMGQEKQQVSIQMVKSTPMVGRVIDPEGKPVANAWIFPDTWRGFRSLEVRVRTDRAGKFVWNDPPIDTVLCDVDATSAGFIRSSHVPMTTGGDEVVVTVKRAPKVTGTVVDAETNQPISSFNIIQGISFSKEQAINWQRDRVIPGHDGKFEMSFDFSYPGYVVRIEADGYLPAESRVFTLDEKQIVLDLKLKKGNSISGTLLTADGKPVAGAQMMLLLAGQNISIQNGRETYNRETPSAVTSADGKFTFPPESSSFKLIALHDAGYLEISSSDFEKSNEVHLSAWAHLQGKLMKGAKPWANEKINASVADGGRPREDNESSVYHQLEATTDAQGAFVMDRVPPGKIMIGRQVRQGTGRRQWWTTSESEQVLVTAGQTVNVQIGGKGCPVEGQVLIPPEIAKRHDWSWGYGNRATAIGREQGNPWYAAILSRIAVKNGSTTKPAEEAPPRTYQLEIDQDGKFRIEDVMPGTYQVMFNILAVSLNENDSFYDTELANGTTSFTVAEMPGGRSDEALVLPEIKLTVLPHLEVGDAAPEFTAKTTDGKDLKLSNYKRKYVLLNFFSNGLPAETSEVPALKAAAAAFGGDERFSMIGIDIGGPAEDAAKYMKTNGMDWTSATLEGVPLPTAMQTFAIHRLPSIWLIGPDGKVIAKDLHGDAIKAALTKSLGPQGL